jgi:hypothetical protein
MSITIFNNDCSKLPKYLFIVNKVKLDKIINRLSYYFKRQMLIQNNIYIMLDDYEYDDTKIIFYNNTIKYKTIYKSFKINNVNLYIPIEEYSKFYLNYKIKMCTRIVETLGVKTLQYNYNKEAQTHLNITQNLSVNNVDLNINLKDEMNKTDNNNEGKLYEKGLCNYLFYSIDNYEKKILDIYSAFIDKNDFNHDFELRDLIHSRLIGNLFDYEVKYDKNFIDSKEVEFALGFYSSKKIGINLKKMVNKKLNVSLKIAFYKYEELINSENMQMDDRCLQLIKKNSSIHLLTNYIEKYIEDNSSFDVYYFMKIAKPEYLHKLINNVNTKDDLKYNGSFFTSLKSTLYPSLLSFDDLGLSKLQDIYIMKLRKNKDIETENANIKCFNIRCNKDYCSCKRYKSLKSIYCYIIRAYNHANQENIITYGLTNTKQFSMSIHYIIMNLKHFTNYEMFINYVSKIINDSRNKKETTTSEDKSIFDVQTLDIVHNDNSSIENSDSDDTNHTTEDDNASHDNSDSSKNNDNNIVIKDKKRAIELSSFS